MIRLMIKNRLYSYERVIFPENRVNSKADIIRYMRFYEKPTTIESNDWDTYITPVTVLDPPEDIIRSNYSKEVRYEVRRAGREGIQYTIYDKLSTDIDRELISDVQSKYFDFCEQIEMPTLKTNLNPTEFTEMIKQGNLVISKAEYENGWTIHVYQVDGINALLWFSFSDYRKDNANKSLAGWANRGLHDADIMWFKRNGYRTYDWGNIASETEPNQIDKFKMSFGGELRTAYCCFVGNTIKGRLLIWARNIKKGNKP